MAEQLIAEDITGREIKRGDRIAYPVRQGSQMWLSTARVESIALGDDGQGTSTITLYARNPQGRSVVIKALSRVVKLPEGTPR